MSVPFVDGLAGSPGVSSLLQLAAVTTIFGLFARIVYNLFLHPLRNVPGPWWLAASGLGQYRMYSSGNAHKILRDLHVQYGDMVRIGPNDVSFAAAYAWSDVFGQKRIPGGSSRAYLENPKEELFYQSLTRPQSLLGMPQADHMEARKTINGAFSAKAVAEQEPLVQRHVDKLIELLHGIAQGGGKEGSDNSNQPKSNIVDIASYVNWAFFDIIGDLSFGEPFGSLADGAEHAWVATIPKAVKGAVVVMGLRRLLGRSVARVAVWFALTHEQRNRLMWHRALASERVSKRIAQGPGRPDFLTPMLENSAFWTADRIHGSAPALITAGSETSATTISAALLFLTTTPATSSAPGDTSPLEKLVAEVRGAFASDADINFAGVRSLPYLGAVIDETLRMHPPAVWGFNRQARPGGTTVAGGRVYLPARTVMTVCHYAMFHNPANFALPDDFVPERWLGDARFAADHKDAFQPFSYGPRNCAGRYLANVEMRTVLARIVYNFELTIQPESRRWAADQKAYAFWEKGPLMMAVTERASKA